MILDGFLIFTGDKNGATSTIAVASTWTDAPTTGTQASSNIVDIGLSGIPSSANGGGARDLGIGDYPALKLWAVVTTAFADGTSLQLQIQGAADNGSGSPDSYTTMWTGPAVLEADLDVGAQLANIDLPRPVPGQALPRFFKLNFITVGTHTAGAVEAGIVLDRLDQIQGSGSVMSGYRAGITVSN